jgi:hypothetical protein
MHPITNKNTSFGPSLKFFQFFNIILEGKYSLCEISQEKSEKVNNFISSLYIH